MDDSQKTACLMALICYFKHKRLKRFFAKSNHRGMPARRQAWIERVLGRLEASILPKDMAIRLEKLLGTSAESWLRMQTAVDL